MDERDTGAAMSAQERLSEIAAEARTSAGQLTALIEQAVREGDDRRVLELDHLFQAIERIVKLCGVVPRRRQGQH